MPVIKHSPELKATVVAEYAEKPDSLSEIAERHGVARSSVTRWATAAGVRRKPKKKATKNVFETSPRKLKETDGAWVYGTDGIARWQTHGSQS